MNQFSEPYKSLGNSDLLKIIGNPNDYQPLAVEAAKVELTARQLTIDELEIANKEYEIQQGKEQAKIEKKRALENIAKKTLFSMLEIIKRPPSKRKIKTIISIIFILIFLVHMVSNIGLIDYMFSGDQSLWDFSMVTFLLPILLIPMGLLFFWLHKKVGWIVLSVYIIYSICYSIIESFELFYIQSLEGVSISKIYSPMLLFPFLCFNIIFFVGVQWAMCRNDIRSDYYINKKTLFLTIGLTACLTAVLHFSNSLV
jgi:hypothetical protein